MLVLGIETSCDETAAAVVEGSGRVRSNIVLSQLDEHRPYGGVVPEIAARGHVLHLDRLIIRAMAEASLDFADLDGVAATAGPGLIGGLMVGLTTAKAIAAVHELPLIAVNHLEAHALTPRLGQSLAFPYLLLLISGGHCQFLMVEDVGAYRRLGTTLDDALGEAFDKAARMMGLPYPGGPAIEDAARSGDADRFDLPRPMAGRPGCDFSFSGLKTAVRKTITDLPGSPPRARDVADLCASFQAAVADVLEDRLGHAAAAFHGAHGRGGALVVAGGVAANRYLRQRLAASAARFDLGLVAPAPALCTDNAAIVAWAGVERLRHGFTDPLDVAARPRWPLDPEAKPAIGAGVKA
ncbi:MAG: tRNA (adenosine(37)-N6)-threonylcarbamoyltransferase complex transferase subunit TsaD [Alphaproteobacteria bacterium]|nr:tRNA (adenosine(37)-N6)-threonylcarbamoyltransferase complex transferase subunit TsaD [Alphaproteobacteria bacterium]MDP6516603.1 tRNA (adenosine(37)-N6)-threonylcarbamoyltransferase complex transferase subunit TsaD [Alphaproteobacteria bacterium]